MMVAYGELVFEITDVTDTYREGPEHHDEVGEGHHGERSPCPVRASWREVAIGIGRILVEGRACHRE